MKKSWKELNRKISRCKKCSFIVKTRNRAVKGIGSQNAKIMIIGLAPGRYGADLTGIPFSRDPSGRLLDEMLVAAGLSRERDVFITNLVKCNPKDNLGRNRQPSKIEILNCQSFLKREMELLKPKIIVPLGRPASEIILDKKIQNMKEFHGRVISKNGRIIFPFIHPGYVIRGAYNKDKYLKEFQQLGLIFQEQIKQESEMSRMDIILMMLYNNNGKSLSIRGKTRLQKLVFLVQKELEDIGYKSRYAFRPYLYGPYSQELYTDITWLKMNDYIEVKKEFNEDIGLITNFNATDKGKGYVANLLKAPYYHLLYGVIANVIKKYGEMSLEKLVDYTHKKYPEYNISKYQTKKKITKSSLDIFLSRDFNDKSI